MSQHPSAIAFHRVLKEMGETHDKKGADYGREHDPFANVRASDDFGVPGWVGCMIRANDKMRRIQKAAAQTVAGEGVALRNESVEDSLLDLAVYAVIGLVIYREEQGRGGTANNAGSADIFTHSARIWHELQKERDIRARQHPQPPQPDATPVDPGIAGISDAAWAIRFGAAARVETALPPGGPQASVADTALPGQAGDVAGDGARAGYADFWRQLKGYADDEG